MLVYDAGMMAKHNAGPLARWLRPGVEDEHRTVPTSREEREGSFRFFATFAPSQNGRCLRALYRFVSLMFIQNRPCLVR